MKTWKLATKSMVATVKTPRQLMAIHLVGEELSFKEKKWGWRVSKQEITKAVSHIIVTNNHHCIVFTKVASLVSPKDSSKNGSQTLAPIHQKWSHLNE